MLLDGRTVARNEFAEKLEHAQKDLNGGWDRKHFDRAKEKAVARLFSPPRSRLRLSAN